MKKQYQDIKALEQRMNYTFQDQALLKEALSHSSLEGQSNNERLEFLGDGVLNLVIAAYIVELFPKADEGQLSRIRAQLVCKDALARVGVQLDLSRAIILGPSEARSGGQQRRSIIADAVEAIIGAVFKDAGFEQARQSILAWFTPLLDDLSLDFAAKDSKTKLQEYCQSFKYSLPVYTLIDEQQSAGENFFVVSAEVQALSLCSQGEGTSRKQAEQLAAATLIDQIISKNSGVNGKKS